MFVIFFVNRLVEQLCDVLIFNHDPPRCVGCEDCGGPSHCGTSCSALVSENVRGIKITL